jgi:hypothetical protein
MIRFPILHVLAILSLLIGASFGLSAGNPYSFAGVVPPDPETYPPIITITSPVNNTAYNTSRVPLTFNVTAPQSRTASYVTVDRVTYEVDWRKEPISVLNGPHQQPSLNLWLSNVSEGKHTILVTARGMGQITNEKELSYKWFFISSSATICFTIDRTPPTVSFLPPENVSSTSAVPLNLTINESYSKIAYSLNGRQNVTVTGNSTLPHMAAGQYNVTFNAWDVAGNVGSSETMNFSVSEKPNTIKEVNDPLLLPAAAVTSIIVVVGVSLLLYKRHSWCGIYHRI